MGDKKKSPQTQITHTEQQAIKRNTIGRRWGHMVGIWIAVGREGGGARHLRKRSLLNGNQMGCILLNRIPGLQLWAGAWPGVLSPWPLVCAEGTWRRGQGVEGGRPRGCDGAASRPQAAGRGSVFLSLCHAVSQPFARISKLEAYQEAILSFLSFLVFFFFYFFLFAI